MSNASNNDLGLGGIFDDDKEADDLDISSFAPKPRRIEDATPRSEVRKRTEEVGFKDRSGGSAPSRPAPRPKPANKPVRRSEYYLTGRNTQLNMKVTPEDKERFKELCDQQNWVSGQLMKYALDAIEEKLADPSDPFWQSRNLQGVD